MPIMPTIGAYNQQAAKKKKTVKHRFLVPDRYWFQLMSFKEVDYIMSCKLAKCLILSLDRPTSSSRRKTTCTCPCPTYPCPSDPCLSDPCLTYPCLSDPCRYRRRRRNRSSRNLEQFALLAFPFETCSCSTSKVRHLRNTTIANSATNYT